MPQIIQDNYVPRPAFAGFHTRDQRFACVVAHRRAGKTVAAVNDIRTRASYSRKKRPRYGYVAPFLSQARQIAWEYLKESTKGLTSKISESLHSVTLKHNQAIIQLYGADNPNALRGQYFDGLLLDEYGDMRPSLWGEILLPTLSDRKGWAVFIGTAKGKNHFYDMRNVALEDPSWFYLELKASQTGIIPADEVKILQSQMTDEQYRQEYECDFTAAVLGTYYAALLNQAEAEGRVGDHTYDPNLPVFAALDLGFTDATAIWFWQETPSGVLFIDYEEANSQPLDYYFDLLRYKPYDYGKIWLPHDARAKSLQTGRSTIEQFLHQKFPVDIQPRLKVQHGIDAARLLLKTAHFAKLPCRQGLETLSSYRRDYDELKKCFKDTPRHDWASHGADAFRGAALVAKLPKFMEQRLYTDKVQLLQPRPLCLENLFTDRDIDRRRAGRRI